MVMLICSAGLHVYLCMFSRVTCLSLHVQQGYTFNVYINEKFYMFSRVKFLYVLYIVHVQQDTSLTVIFVKGTRALMDNKP